MYKLRMCFVVFFCENQVNNKLPIIDQSCGVYRTKLLGIIDNIAILISTLKLSCFPYLFHIKKMSKSVGRYF